MSICFILSLRIFSTFSALCLSKDLARRFSLLLKSLVAWLTNVMASSSCEFPFREEKRQPANVARPSAVATMSQAGGSFKNICGSGKKALILQLWSKKHDRFSTNTRHKWEETERLDLIALVHNRGETWISFGAKVFRRDRWNPAWNERLSLMYQCCQRDDVRTCRMCAGWFTKLDSMQSNTDVYPVRSTTMHVFDNIIMSKSLESLHSIQHATSPLTSTT